MAELHKFQRDLAGNSLKSPPYVIRAKDLDGNFDLCFPRPIDGDNAPYIIERRGDGGWILRGSKIFLLCENGKPIRYRLFAEKVPQDT
jgi:hypothetical protein